MVRVGLALAYGCVLLAGAAPVFGDSLWNGTTGALTGWQSVAGSFVSVQNHTFAPASPGVGYRLLLSTGSDDDDNADPPLYAPDASDVASILGVSLADFGGRPGIDAGPAIEGSAVQKTFTAHAGDVLSITYDFLTAEGLAAYANHPGDVIADSPLNKDDFAFIAITRDGVTDVTRLADVLTPNGTAGLSGFRYSYHTGFRTLDIPLSIGSGLTDGTYTVALGVMDGAVGPDLPDYLGRQIESALLVQSLDVSSPNAVPLPAAAPAGAILLGALVTTRRTRRLR